MLSAGTPISTFFNIKKYKEEKRLFTDPED